MAALESEPTNKSVIQEGEILTNTLETNEQEEEDYFFDKNDVKGWSCFLENQGYCVLRSQLEPQEIEAAKESIMNDIERCFEGVEKDNINTWGKIPNGSAGIMGTLLPQTAGPWMIRSSESIRSAFASIWETDDLLVSMDSVLLWLPWWYNSNWKPMSEGLHIDQNPYHKPDKCCVQGMVPLLDVTDISGGLEVIPLSHTSEIQSHIKEKHPFWQRNFSDWCVIRNQLDKSIPKPKLLKAKAGDLILWDSRLVHGGRVGNGNMKLRDEASMASRPELARLAIPICMTPRSFARKNTLDIRQRGFNNGVTFSHWPHEAVITNRSNKTNEYIPIELTNRVRELI